MSSGRHHGAEADVVIVGAGSAGCVLAERLSRDPKRSVVLLEAGPRDVTPLVRVPKGFGKLIGNPRAAWHYPVSDSGSGLDEQWVRGRLVGGSSAVNGMIYNRGFSADYHEAESVAGGLWSWPSMLNAFRAIENHELGSSDLRGADGPLDVSMTRLNDELRSDFVAAAASVGLRRTDDTNDGGDARVGPATRTIHRGRRVSSAHAFLRTATKRPNLKVVTGSVAEQVVWQRDRAVGVRVRRRGDVTVFGARKRVILCAGGLETPLILERSGIGDSGHLRTLGIDVRVDQPLVGEGLKEHRCFSLQFRLAGNEGDNRWLSTLPRQAVSAGRYALTRGGPLATGAYDVLAFCDTAGDGSRADGQLLMAPFSALPFEPGTKLGVERAPGMQIIGYVLRPESEGSVHAASSDPTVAPRVVPGYFTSAHDRAVTTALFKIARKIVGSEPLAPHVHTETRPGPSCVSDEEILDAAIRKGYCGNHAVGTARMGIEESAVVDPGLSVRGVSGLSLLDASVLPVMVSGNINGPLMAAAWNASERLESIC